MRLGSGCICMHSRLCFSAASADNIIRDTRRNDHLRALCAVEGGCGLCNDEAVHQSTLYT